MMKPFGFERGKRKFSGSRYPEGILRPSSSDQQRNRKSRRKRTFRHRLEKTAENAINALKSIKTTEKANEYKLDRIEKRVGFKLEAENGTLKQRNENLEKDIEKKKSTLKHLTTSLQIIKRPFYFRNRKRTQSQSARRAAAEKIG